MENKKYKPNKKAINKIKNIYYKYRYYFESDAVRLNIVLMLILEGNLSQEEALDIFNQWERELSNNGN